MPHESTALAKRDEIAPIATATEAEHSVAVEKARLLAKSEVIPAAFQSKPANVLVALEYANRLGCSVLAVMQNLDVIHGRPSLRATFLIGTVNASGRFTPIRFRWQGTEGTDDWGCRAVATDRESGEECIGPLITIGLAKAEGWWSKKDRNGRETSKWQTIPELMLTYRAGAWWTRIYCPELSLGLHTSEEVEDIGPSPRSHAAAVRAALHADDEIPEGEATVIDGNGRHPLDEEDLPPSSTLTEQDGPELDEFQELLGRLVPAGGDANERQRQDLIRLADEIYGAGTQEALIIRRVAEDVALGKEQVMPILSAARAVLMARDKAGAGV